MNPIHKSRIESIDLLRGIVMIIMALDHLREYVHFDSLIFSPTDLQHAGAGLFATRLMTHLCAPTFIFLAGTSAYFIAQRKTRKETSFFLMTRGLWLILLQMTLVRFSWNFDPEFHYNANTIISIIGFCMIGLALLIHLRFKVILIIGLIMVLGHNLLDNISFKTGTIAEGVWAFLHATKVYELGNGYRFMLFYPFIPWVGVMALGYCMGRLYNQDYSVEIRRKVILQLGIGSILTFFILRWINIYGDPEPWHTLMDNGTTIMSFFNVGKYPPSLLFLCLTLGVALTILGLLEGHQLQRWRSIALFGKVALFYYVTHIFVIHIFAIIAVVLAGFSWQNMIFKDTVASPSPRLIGNFGFNLGQVYIIWIVIIVLLYPACSWWYSVKTRNKSKWWVSYV